MANGRMNTRPEIQQPEKKNNDDNGITVNSSEYTELITGDTAVKYADETDKQSVKKNERDSDRVENKLQGKQR